MTREQIVAAVFDAKQDMLKEAGLQPAGESIRIIMITGETPIVCVKGDSDTIRKLFSYAVSWCMDMAVEAGRSQEWAEQWAKKISEDAIAISKL